MNLKNIVKESDHELIEKSVSKLFETDQPGFSFHLSLLDKSYNNVYVEVYIGTKSLNGHKLAFM